RLARILEKPRAERVVGLEREETAIEPVSRRRREAVVRLLGHHRAPDPGLGITPAHRPPRFRGAMRAPNRRPRPARLRWRRARSPTSGARCCPSCRALPP